MDVSHIAGAVNAASAAIKIVTSIRKTLRDAELKELASDLADHIIDVQAKVIAVQSDYENQARVIRELEQQIKDYEQWDAEASRYQLQQIASGIFVYALKPDHHATEPAHWLCPNCFHSRKKSILIRPSVDLMNYKCQACGFDIVPESSYGEAIANWGNQQIGHRRIFS